MPTIVRHTSGGRAACSGSRRDGELDAAADRILSGEELRGQALVDDGGLESGRAVGLVEAAPATQLHADGVEELRADRDEGRPQALPPRPCAPGVPRSPSRRRQDPNGGTLVVNATASSPGSAASRGSSRS